MIPAYWTTAVANHLWQSTVFAGIAALLALALRNNHARIRYALWLIASLKFLVPFSLLLAMGSHIEWPAARPLVQPEFKVAMQQITQPFPQIPITTPASTAPKTSLAPALLLALWICGFAAVCLSWARRWRHMRSIVRAATPLPLNISVPVRTTPALVEPGVFGIFRPVLLLPQGITEHLSPSHVKAILAHELCHIRRHDNLAAAVHMAVQAIFWFHPLVWWLGARLVEERESACDEEVLRLGNEPEIYAESILKTCQFYLESPLTCMSGISGSDLKKRVVRIMSQHLASQLSFSRKVLLAAAAIVTVTGPILVGLAQSQPATPRPSFEVASIKPNKSGDHGIRIENMPGGFRASNVTLKFLIEFAYNLKDSQLSGASGWIDSEHYDIDAKAEAASAGSVGTMSDDELERRRLMMQSLLADRFKLTVHHETKELPIYLLVVAKSGSKLHESTPKPDAEEDSRKPEQPEGARPRRRTAMMGRGELNMSEVPISMMADALSRQLGRTVIDKTELKGNYDIALKWTPDETQGAMFRGPAEGAPREAPPTDASGPSIFTAIQEQLGLKLESQKGPVDTLVLDHVERPSAN